MTHIPFLLHCLLYDGTGRWGQCPLVKKIQNRIIFVCIISTFSLMYAPSPSLKWLYIYKYILFQTILFYFNSPAIEYRTKIGFKQFVMSQIMIVGQAFRINFSVNKGTFHFQQTSMRTEVCTTFCWSNLKHLNAEKGEKTDFWMEGDCTN